MILEQKTKDNYAEWLYKASTEGSVALINKDLDWTSFDVVAKLRTLTRIKKIGHAGTLDPLATGLLIVCLGKATKTISSYQDAGKSYEATIRLGAVTKSYDREFEEENVQDTSHLTINKIENAVTSFIGESDQMPPDFSAKKINGKAAYKLARQDKEVVLQPVPIQIYNINNILIDLPFVKFQLECSKGTYIRSLARDIGEKLGCGAYLKALERTEIGDFSVLRALTIKEIQELVSQNNTNILSKIEILDEHI